MPAADLWVAGGATADPTTLTLDFNPSLGSGPARLPASLRSYPTMTESVYCTAAGISGTTLTCATGGAMVEAGAGASPTSGLRAPFTETTARAVSYAAKYHEASSTTVGDVATDDLVVEAHFYAAWDGGGSDVIAAKRDDGGTGNGWDLAMTDAAIVTLTIDAGAASQSASCVGTASTWNYVACFVDRDRSNGMACSCNGDLGTATDPTAASGTLTTTDPLRIGANVTAGTQFTGRLSFVRAWSGVGLSQAYYDSQADELFLSLAGGVYADVGGAPLDHHRVTMAMLDVDRDGDGERYLFPVAANYPRVAKRGTSIGAIHEMARYNKLVYSEQLGSTWTSIDAGDTLSSNVAVAPDFAATADDIVCNVNAVARTCGRSQSVTLDAEQTVFSTFAKEPAAGDPDFVVLRVNTVANTATWFNLTTCTVGTTGSAVAFAYADPYGADYCRVSIAFTGTVAAHSVDVIAATADNDIDFANPGGAVNLRSWGMQVDSDPYSPTPTSYYPSGISPGLRYDDYWRWPATALPGAVGTMAIQFTCQSRPINLGTNHFMSFGGGATEYNAIKIETSTGDAPAANAYSNSLEQWSITPGAPDVLDGASHEARVTFEVNSVALYVDGVVRGTDTVNASPGLLDSADYVNIFSSITVTGTPVGCLAERARLWNNVQVP